MCGGGEGCGRCVGVGSRVVGVRIAFYIFHTISMSVWKVGLVFVFRLFPFLSSHFLFFLIFSSQYIPFYAIKFFTQSVLEPVYKPLSYLGISFKACMCACMHVCVCVCVCCGCWRDSYGIQFLLCIPLNDLSLSGGALITY